MYDKFIEGPPGTNPQDMRPFPGASTHQRGEAWTPGYALKIGDKILMDWPRSRWAIMWDRICHPFTEPARTEKKMAEVTATGISGSVP